MTVDEQIEDARARAVQYSSYRVNQSVSDAQNLHAAATELIFLLPSSSESNTERVQFDIRVYKDIAIEAERWMASNNAGGQVRYLRTNCNDTGCCR